MTSGFYIKQNDLQPNLKAQLEEDDGTAVDLSNASSVDFYMVEAGSTTLKVDSTATITNASEGKVEYEWSSGDTDTSGTFKAEFQVNWSDGDAETFPSTGYTDVHIEEDLG